MAPAVDKLAQQAVKKGEIALQEKALAFLVAQEFNILWTLLLAYLLFGGILFPSPVF